MKPPTEYAFAEQPYTSSMEMAAVALQRIADAFPGTTVLIAISGEETLEVVADWTKPDDAAVLLARLLRAAPNVIQRLDAARAEQTP